MVMGNYFGHKAWYGQHITKWKKLYHLSMQVSYNMVFQVQVPDTKRCLSRIYGLSNIENRVN